MGSRPVREHFAEFTLIRLLEILVDDKDKYGSGVDVKNVQRKLKTVISGRALKSSLPNLPSPRFT